MEWFDTRSHNRCSNLSSHKYRSWPRFIVRIEKGCSDQKKVQDFYWENQKVNHSFSLYYAAGVVFGEKSSPSQSSYHQGYSVNLLVRYWASDGGKEVEGQGIAYEKGWLNIALITSLACISPSKHPTSAG